MTDLALEWHDDFQVDSTGDLATVDGDDEVRQRLERRLFTAVKGYVWHPDYGAGLPQDIGKPISITAVKSIVARQLALEATVAPFPPVQLTVTALSNNLSAVHIGIKYWDKQTGATVSFEITT